MPFSAAAVGLAASTAFNPVSARFAPAAGCLQLPPTTGQPPGPGDASTPGSTPCATLPAPGFRTDKSAQQRLAKVIRHQSYAYCESRLRCASHLSQQTHTFPEAQLHVFLLTGMQMRIP